MTQTTIWLIPDPIANILSQFISQNKSLGLSRPIQNGLINSSSMFISHQTD